MLFFFFMWSSFFIYVNFSIQFHFEYLLGNADFKACFFYRRKFLFIFRSVKVTNSLLVFKSIQGTSMIPTVTTFTWRYSTNSLILDHLNTPGTWERWQIDETLNLCIAISLKMSHQCLPCWLPLEAWRGWRPVKDDLARVCWRATWKVFEGESPPHTRRTNSLLLKEAQNHECTTT